MTIIAAEEALYFRDDGSWFAGFGQIAVAAHLECLLAIRRESVRSQCDYRDVFGLGVVFQHLGGFPSVDNRNRYVHEYEIGPGGPGLGDPLLAIPCLSHFVAEVLENGGVNDTIVFIILNKQNHFTRLAHLASHGYCNLCHASKYLTIPYWNRNR